MGKKIDDRVRRLLVAAMDLADGGSEYLDDIVDHAEHAERAARLLKRTQQRDAAAMGSSDMGPSFVSDAN